MNPNEAERLQRIAIEQPGVPRAEALCHLLGASNGGDIHASRALCEALKSQGYGPGDSLFDKFAARAVLSEAT